MRRLRGGNYKETDEREVIHRYTRYEPLPHLVHRFHWADDDRQFYIGSEIDLEEENLEMLSRSVLQTDLRAFHDALRQSGDTA